MLIQNHSEADHIPRGRFHWLLLRGIFDTAVPRVDRNWFRCNQPQCPLAGKDGVQLMEEIKFWEKVVGKQ